MEPAPESRPCPVHRMGLPLFPTSHLFQKIKILVKRTQVGVPVGGDYFGFCAGWGEGGFPKEDHRGLGGVLFRGWSPETTSDNHTAPRPALRPGFALPLAPCLGKCLSFRICVAVCDIWLQEGDTLLGPVKVFSLLPFLPSLWGCSVDACPLLSWPPAFLSLRKPG